jgi:rhodanese-related sulfurtransferase
MNAIRLLTLATYLVAIFISLGACAQNQGVTDVSNEELEKLLGQGVTLVDIRTPEEWRQTGIIKGSQTITLFDQNGQVAEDFVSKLTAAAPTNQPVALICRTGSRTRAASAMITQQLGYKKVYNVSKGITDWIRSGKPIAQL